MRDGYRSGLAWCISAPWLTLAFFAVLIVGSLSLFPILGRDFFPSVDAGQMRLHVRAPAGSRLETTAAYFARVERDVRRIVGDGQIDNVLANIGLPYSGMNMAVGDTATVGTMDGELLVSLKEGHTPTAAHVAELRRQLPKDFPDCQFFFQAADIVNQVLNFGAPAPIDVRIVGSDPVRTYDLATRIAHDLAAVPGVVDSHVFQVPAVPGLNVRVNRGLAQQVDVTQRGAASSLLVTLNSSGQVNPNFWVNPATARQLPARGRGADVRDRQPRRFADDPAQDGRRARAGAAADERGHHRPGEHAGPDQPEQRPAGVRRQRQRAGPRPGRRSPTACGLCWTATSRGRPSPITVKLTGQIDTMTASYNGLFGGMALAVALVYLLMVIKFQSWVAPLVVLLAVPFALSGVCWGLFLTRTYLSVPALMGGLMCIGLATANSILVVSFAEDRFGRGVHRRRGRPGGGVHPDPAGADDGRGHDPGHAADGLGPGRRGRAERPAGPGRGGRANVRHVRHARVRAGHVRADQPRSRNDQ